MRILVNGMQSSGASFATYTIGQIEDTIVVVDVWSGEIAPDLRESKDAKNVIVKCVITEKYDIEEHIESFDPDKTILLTRHPCHNYISLSKKHYSDEGGDMDKKFRKLEKEYESRDKYDAILKYEDLLLYPKHFLEDVRETGLEINNNALIYRRTKKDVKRYNKAHSEWCKNYFKEKWALGKARAMKPNPEFAFKYVPRNIEGKIKKLCPTLYDEYKEYYEDEVSKTYMYWSIIKRKINKIKNDIV